MEPGQYSESESSQHAPIAVFVLHPSFSGLRSGLSSCDKVGQCRCYWYYRWKDAQVPWNTFCPAAVNISVFVHANRVVTLNRTGDLRFQLPQPVDAYKGAFNASVFGPACPQQSGPYPGPYANASDLPTEVAAIFTAYSTGIPSDEDCRCLLRCASSMCSFVLRGLSINVVKPADTLPHSGLPVAVVRPPCFLFYWP